MINQVNLDNILQVRLDDRKTKDLYRGLTVFKDKIDFCSNDYLGLARSGILNLHPGEDLSSGAKGARLISGNSIEAEQAEETIARFYNAGDALVFNCGYMANVGLLSAIAGREDTLIVDAHSHASIIDGIQLSHASKFKFRHNDTESLEQKLRHAKGNKFVVVESIYSMDGDEAPLEQIVEICSAHGAFLVVDEAHATGVWGEDGRGLVSRYKLEKGVAACIHTFGKALGLHGAAVTCSHILKNYLVNFARPFIYSTALPPIVYRQISRAYEALPALNRQSLVNLIDYFRNAASVLNHVQFLDSRSQIQGIIVGGNTKTKALSDYLFAEGFAAKAILSPTVPAGTERIRICLHSFNTEKEVDSLLLSINTFLR